MTELTLSAEAVLVDEPGGSSARWNDRRTCDRVGRTDKAVEMRLTAENLRQELKPGGD